MPLGATIGKNALEGAHDCAYDDVMDMPSIIRQAETRLAEAGISVGDFCDDVKINRATWQRWKAGTTAPTIVLWMRVVAALPPEPIDAPRAQSPAAA